MAAGAAAGTAGAGPIGGAVGAAVGAVIGGLAGKSVAEHINPTEEDAYWREHHTREPYFDRMFSYDDYRGAYRTGYEGYSRLRKSGKRYEEIEPELRRDYERNYSTSRLTWDKARAATRAAWNRLENRPRSDRAGVTPQTRGAELRDLSGYIGYDVVDRNGNNIGTLDCLWADHNGEPAFIGVRTGWFLGKTHVVPTESVDVSEQSQRLRLPYSEEKVKSAPAYDAESDMTDEKENEIYNYYGLSARSSTRTGPSASPAGMVGPTPGAVSGSARAEGYERPDPTRSTAEAARRLDRPGQNEATLQLSEEQLRVGKREVEAGGVRLRKVVRTEVVNQPVELRREEVIIERVPARGTASTTKGSFQEQEVYIPLRREEAVVEKEVRVREEVRARKESQTDTQQVTERVRREDVDIERSGEAKERTNRGDRKA